MATLASCSLIRSLKFNFVPTETQLPLSKRFTISLSSFVLSSLAYFRPISRSLKSLNRIKFMNLSLQGKEETPHNLMNEKQIVWLKSFPALYKPPFPVNQPRADFYPSYLHNIFPPRHTLPSPVVFLMKTTIPIKTSVLMKDPQSLTSKKLLLELF